LKTTPKRAKQKTANRQLSDPKGNRRKAVTAEVATAKQADSMPASLKPAVAQKGSPPDPNAQRGNDRPQAAPIVKEPAASGTFSSRKNGRSLAANPPETVLEEAPLRKTPLTDAELAEFREMLLAKRRELVGDMNNMTDEARRSGAPGGTASSMPIHMADLGSDTWEQELTLGLIENERGLLREIDEALSRIENRTYGICIATNKPIGKARLRFKPWAKYCIEYARKVEQGRG
jgi:RNA polymerase-binding protein DksA